MKRRLLIVTAVDTGPHGLGVCQGVGQYAASHGKPWIIRTFPVGMSIPGDLRPVGAIASVGHGTMLKQLLDAGCRHVVNVSALRSVLPPHTVCLHNESVGRLAARHLLSRGYRHFVAFEQAPDLGYARRRLMGFLDEVHSHGLKCTLGNWNLKGVATQIAAGRKAGGELVSWLKQLPLPVGIFCIDDKSAQLLAEIADAHGLAIPGQAGLIGSDNSMAVRTGHGLISSVELGTQSVGFEAAHMLDLLIGGKPVPRDPLLIEPIGVAERESTSFAGVRDSHVVRALRFIQEHIGERISSVDVARDSDVSRRWLERRFIRSTGRTILEHIHDQKVERAKQLLLTTTMRQTEIAAQLGFRAVTRFSAVFSAAVGTPPGRYRKRSRIPQQQK